MSIKLKCFRFEQTKAYNSVHTYLKLIKILVKIMIKM